MACMYIPSITGLQQIPIPVVLSQACVCVVGYSMYISRAILYSLPLYDMQAIYFRRSSLGKKLTMPNDISDCSWICSYRCFCGVVHIRESVFLPVHAAIIRAVHACKMQFKCTEEQWIWPTQQGNKLQTLKRIYVRAIDRFFWPAVYFRIHSLRRFYRLIQRIQAQTCRRRNSPCPVV